MVEKMKEFVAIGHRRMIIAIVGIGAVTAVEIVSTPGISMPGAIGIGVITLGYYGSKFAEAIKAFFESKVGK